MSHHHHHHHSDPHHKRQQNLAWFGIVMVVTILAILGLAILSGNGDHKLVQVHPAPPVTVDQPLANPPLGSVEAPPPVIEPPVAHHHKVRHHRAAPTPSCDMPSIPGYASDGSVVAISNPDCAAN